MGRKCCVLAILLMNVATPLFAHASILLEPYAAYSSGQTKGGAQSASGSDTISGINYGGRLGIKRFGFMIGAEYLAGKLTVKDTSNVNLTQSDIGAFIGYQAPLVGLRIYGTYFFSSNDTLSVSPSAKLKQYYGTKVGVGYQFAPFIALNAEYYMAQYKQSETSSGTTTLSPKEQANYFMLTLSLPLTFP